MKGVSAATLILIAVALFLLWFIVNADQVTTERVRGSLERLKGGKWR